MDRSLRKTIVKSITGVIRRKNNNKNKNSYFKTNRCCETMW